jgi:hypothetical protein
MAGYGITGGNAAGQVTVGSGQALTVNANPLFQFGSGSATNSPSASASSSSSPTQAPALTQQNLPAGLGGLVATPAFGAASTLPQLGSGTLMLIALAIGLVLVLGGGGEGRGRR